MNAVVSEALHEYLRTDARDRKIRLALPVLQELFDEKFAQVEVWLRPLAAGARLYSTVAAFLALELLSGSRVAPEEAKDVLLAVRGRAYKYLRRDRDLGRQDGPTT